MSTTTTSIDDDLAAFFVARQPILDRSSRTVGYELLFRGNLFAANAEFVDGDTATAQVLLNALTEFGLDALVGRARGYVNLTEHFIAHPELLAILPRDKVVLEVLETVQPTPEVYAGLAALVADGFTVALDDVQYRPQLDPLLDLAHIVKYDVSQVGVAELRERVIADHAKGRTVAVERIETSEDHDAAFAAGADLFQGFFFARPTTFATRGVTPNRLAMLRLLARINDPDAALDDIVELVSQDVGMSVKTLRFVNAGSHYLVNRVESIHHAAVLLGLDKLRSWTNLALMTSLAEAPFEVVRLALVRAKFCEIVARQRHAANPAAYYTAGMLSLLDVLTGVPIADLVDGLGLHDDVRSALLDVDGPVTAVVREAARAERTGLCCEAAEPLVACAQYDAIAWTNRLLESVVAEMS